MLYQKFLQQKIPPLTSLLTNASLLGSYAKTKTIVFNKSDKGRDLVLQNRTDYVKNGLEHLQYPATHKQLEGDPTNSICQ